MLFQVQIIPGPLLLKAVQGHPSDTPLFDFAKKKYLSELTLDLSILRDVGPFACCPDEVLEAVSTVSTVQVRALVQMHFYRVSGVLMQFYTVSGV